MELCPTFKTGKKQHPDFEAVPSCQVKIVVRILPVTRSSARLIFQGPLSYPRRECYSHAGGRRYNLPAFAIVILTGPQIVLRSSQRLGLCPWEFCISFQIKGKLVLDWVTSSLGSDPCSARCILPSPSRGNHLKCHPVCVSPPMRVRILGGRRGGREKEMPGTQCFLWLC